MVLQYKIRDGFAVCAAMALAAAHSPVKIVDEGKVFTIGNGQVTAQSGKTAGDMTSLKFHGLELMGYGSGRPAGYWE
jgi:hypothetical protein